MNKKDFNKLEIVKQVDYINKKIKESNKTTKEICIEIGIGLSTVSERFKKHGYIFNRSLKQYVLQQLEGQESFINDNINELKELLSIDIKALNQMVEDYITKQNTKFIITDDKTTVTSLRLNKELYTKVKEEAATEKIGITEIFNRIMLDFLNK